MYENIKTNIVFYECLHNSKIVGQHFKPELISRSFACNVRAILCGQSCPAAALAMLLFLMWIRVQTLNAVQK